MKNLIVLALLAFVSLGFISCSGDDDGSNDVVNDSLYGVWDSDYKVTNGSWQDGAMTCNEKLQYNFRSNGTFVVKTFTGENPDDCLDDTETSGSWEYRGDNKYLIHNNNVTITDANRDQYTFHLDFVRSNEIRWYTLADHNAGNDTFVVFKK